MVVIAGENVFSQLCYLVPHQEEVPVTHPLIPPHGGYRGLRSFQSAQLAKDATVDFCDRIVEKRSRMRDQTVQAARSGVQNAAEWSMASAEVAANTLVCLINRASSLLQGQNEGRPGWRSLLKEEEDVNPSRYPAGAD